VLDLNASNGVDPQIASSLSETITTEAGRIGAFQVSSQKDLSTLLGIERQKQLLGCGEESTNCIMELAEAMGSRFVLSGSLVKLGNTWQLNLQTLDTHRSAPVGRSTRLANDLETLRAQLPWALAEATGTPAPRSPSRVVPTGLMIAGGVGALTGGVLVLQAFTREQTSVAELKVSGATLRTVQYYADEKRAVDTLRIAAGISAGVGVALFVTGLLINPSSDAVVRVSVVPSLSGAALVGVFP
jgi:TolB-like protein